MAFLWGFGVLAHDENGIKALTHEEITIVEKVLDVCNNRLK